MLKTTLILALRRSASFERRAQSAKLRHNGGIARTNGISDLIVILSVVAVLCDSGDTMIQRAGRNCDARHPASGPNGEKAPVGA